MNTDHVVKKHSMLVLHAADVRGQIVDAIELFNDGTPFQNSIASNVVLISGEEQVPFPIGHEDVWPYPVKDVELFLVKRVVAHCYPWVLGFERFEIEVFGEFGLRIRLNHFVDNGVRFAIDMALILPSTTPNVPVAPVFHVSTMQAKRLVRSPRHAFLNGSSHCFARKQIVC